MRALPLTVLAVSVLASATLLTTPAHAAPSPEGVRCGLAAIEDPVAPPGTQTGVIDAGPLYLGDDSDPTVIYSGSITCTVQVNGPAHYYPDHCALTGPFSTGVVSASGTCSYTASEADNIYLCTQVQVDWYTLYWNDSNDQLVDGYWTTDPSASCYLGITVDPEPLLDPVRELLNDLLPLVDSIIDTVTGLAGQAVQLVLDTVNNPPKPPVECSDGVDNDGDGWTDHPNDPDCADALDTSEAATPPPPPGCPNVAGVPYCVSLTAGAEYQRFEVSTSSTPVNVAAYLDSYEFTLPNSGKVILPCVTVVADTTTADACALAGARQVSREVLVSQPVGQPGLGGTPLVTVRVCHADLVATVGPYGLTTFPAYTVC